MAGLLGKIFGKKEKGVAIDDVVEDAIIGIIDRGKFELSYELSVNDEKKSVEIELFGEDEELLKNKEGQFLDALQLFVTRVVQNQIEDAGYMVTVDSDGFRQEANDELIRLAEKLKGIALKKKKSVYFRALPPKDRKLIHQYLAEDGKVKSQSVGDGLYKKIKIFPKRKEDSKNSSTQA